MTMHPGGFAAARGSQYYEVMTETFQVSGDALVRKPRKARQSAAPVAVVKVPLAVLQAARASTDCDCKIKPQPDGSVIIVNSTKHCP